MNSTLKTADHPVTDHVFDAIVIGVGVIENEVTQKVCPAGMTTLAKSLLKKNKMLQL